jgi:hypothetical protein
LTNTDTHTCKHVLSAVMARDGTIFDLSRAFTYGNSILDFT